MNHPAPLLRQSGLAMIEVLVAILVVAFGLLGYVGLQAQTAVGQLEGYQRSQALILVNDLVQRINLNRGQASAYVATNVGVDATLCAAPATQAATDLCAWGQLIQGAAEKRDNSVNVGGMIGARGCVTSDVAGHYTVSIAWQGIRASGASVNPCGLNAYTAENLRRTVSVVVQIANLGG